MKYATLYVAFSGALDRYTDATLARVANGYNETTEHFRNEEHNKKMEVLRLYNNLLTELQKLDQGE